MNLMETEMLLFVCGVAIFDLTVVATDIFVKDGNPLVAVFNIFGVVFCGVNFVGLMRRREQILSDRKK